MDAIQTIKNEIDKYLSSNDLYNTYKKQWRYLLESYVGGDEYRRAGHLTRYQLESDGEYAARLATTPLQNHCQSVISVYSSFLFRNTPVRDFGSIANLPELVEFMYDADLDGRSFDGFMKDVSVYSSIFGHNWVLVTKPNVGASSRGAELEMGVRPYVSMLTPLTVLDWHWTRDVTGRYELSYFKYIEEVNGDVTTVKEWTKESITTAIVNEHAVSISKTEEPNGLGKIPAVCVYNKRSIIRGIGVSDISDIADTQKFIYNATSEIEQSIRLDSHPSLVKTPETNAGIGAGSLIHMPENLDPGLKPYLLEFGGASVDKILASINHAIENIDKMANTGAIRSTEAKRMSGVAQEQEFQLLNARLSEKGDSLELAEEQIWKLFCEYQNYTWDGIVDYPDSFNIRDAASDLEMLLKVSTAPVMSQVFTKELQKEIVKLIVDDEEKLTQILEEIEAMPSGVMSVDMPDESSMEEDYNEGFEPHIMMDPESGEMQIAKVPGDHDRLNAMGWIHLS
jgi:hypothetical protein